MKKVLRYFVFFSALLVLNYCYYDSEEDLFPSLNTECNLENISFSATITKILENRCWSCHSNSNAAVFGNNINLENYSDVANQFNSVLGAVNRLPGYSPMPKNGNKISSCELNQMKLWNEGGKLNN